MPTAYATFEEEAKKLIDPSREKAKVDSNAFYDSQVASTNKLYDAEAEKAGKAYEDSYRENAVQKLINERQVAENMANLGLTNSGLNRTQQTAVQLSYANQKANIDRQRQNNIDDINLNRTQALDTIEQNRLSSAASIDQEYDKLINETAATNYETYLDYLSEQAKTAQKQQETTQKNDKTVLQKWYGETKDGLLKFIGSDGKSKYVTPGKNPYTGKSNAKISAVIDGKCVIDKQWQKENKNSTDVAVRACAKYGVFSNGYQPKGVCYKDDNGKIVDVGALEPTTREDYMNGNLQTVWKAVNSNTYWIWNGKTNEYELYDM